MDRDDGVSLGRRTLPPPEWVSPGRVGQAAPTRRKLRRVRGRPAEEAELRAALEAARDRGDATLERDVTLRFARRLVALDADLAEACRLGERALELGEGGGFARELAGWYERSSRFARAGELLVRHAEDVAAADPLDGAASFGRAGVLFARAGETPAFVAALERASACDPTGALPHELLGASHAWAGEVVDAPRARAAFREAARRRAAAGAGDAVVEDVLRLLELGGAALEDVEPLIETWLARGRVDAVEVLLHDLARDAEAAGRPGAPIRERLVAALGSVDDLETRALAALGGGPAGAAVLDGCLARAGALDWLLVRFELRGADRESLRSRAQLLRGPLASPRGAALAFTDLVVAGGGSEAARELLECLDAASLEPDTVASLLLRASLAPALDDDTRAALAARAEAVPPLATRPWLAPLVRASAAVPGPGEEEADVDALDDHAGVPTEALEARLVALREEGPSRALLSVLASRLGRSEPGDAPGLLLEAAAVAERLGARTLLPRVLGDPRLGPGARAGYDAARTALAAGDADGAARAFAARGAASAAAYRVERPTSALDAARAVLELATSVRRGGDGAALGRALTLHGARALVVASAADEALEVAMGLGDPHRAGEAKLRSELGLPLDAASQRVLFGGVGAGAAAERVLATSDDPDRLAAAAQRLVALRPGDVQAMDRLLVILDDAVRLGDAIGSALGQVVPSASMAGPVAGALERLAQLDPPRATVVARRVLDVVGAAPAGVRAAVEHVAARAGDVALRAKLLERALAGGVADPREATLDLADVYRSLGAASEALRALVRGAEAGADAGRLARALAELERGAADGDDAVRVARLRSTVAEREGDRRVRGERLRELAAALWGLAKDRVGAVHALHRAARLAPQVGFDRLREDLVELTTEAEAVGILVSLAEGVDPSESARLLVQAARLASGADPKRAFELARAALARDGTCTEAVEVVELAATSLGRERDLTSVYDGLSAAALGRFGRRAVNHRAARFFDARAVPTLALKHAALAFGAVPSEAGTLPLLQRTAVRAGKESFAVRTVEQVAEQVAEPGQRAVWLLAASGLAADDAEGRLQRAEILLKAVVLRGGPVLSEKLARAVEAVLAADPGEREGLALRLVSASAHVGRRADGPDGARACLVFASLAAGAFGDTAWALDAIERALEVAGDLEELEALASLAPKLARDDGAGAFVERALAAALAPYSPVGAPALTLVARLAEERGDAAASARAFALAAEREPDDDARVSRAAMHVERLEAPERERFHRRAPAARCVEALRETARQALGHGRADEAVLALARAVELVDDVPADLAGELREARARAGLPSDLPSARASAPPRAQEPPAVAASTPPGSAPRSRRLGTRADLDGALEGLADLDLPSRLERLRELVAEAEGEALLEGLRCLARTEEEAGGGRVAESTWAAVLDLDEGDDAAAEALERAYVERRAHAELVELLGRRARSLRARPGGTARAIALGIRRAAILEQRLDDGEGAREELERILVEVPEHRTALRFLANLHERAGRARDAAEALAQLARLADGDAYEVAQLDLRRARVLLAVGETVEARGIVLDLCVRHPDLRDAAELRLSLARAVGEARELGDALDQLAGAVDDAGEASRLLLEAAQAAGRAGDVEGALARAAAAERRGGATLAARLFHRGLAYRLRGGFGVEEAREVLASLTVASGSSEPDDDVLGAFLVAEAEVAAGAGDGLEGLRAVTARVGARGLSSLGLAERLAARGELDEALARYEEAVRGDLLGLRRRVDVLAAAVRLALTAGAPERAEAFLAAARPRLSVEDLPVADALAAEVARRPSGSPPKASSAPPAPSRLRASSEPPSRRASSLLPPLEVGASRRDDADALLAAGLAREGAGDAEGAAEVLLSALDAGALDAAPLLERLEVPSSLRHRVRLASRLRLAETDPGAEGPLRALLDAATAETNRAHERALLFLLGQGGPPPSLASVPPQPEVTRVLSRPTLGPAHDALALLWEKAASLLAKSPASQGVTGVERVTPGPTSPLARLYEQALRHVDLAAPPLFHHRTAVRDGARPAFGVAPLAPPAVIVRGEVPEERPEVAYALGVALASASPANVLVVEAVEGARTFRALLAAFGPPGAARALEPEVARLAEELWHAVPGSVQRRLCELLEGAPTTSFEEVARGSRRAAQRFGLFLCGDLRVAARAVLEAEGTPVPDLATPRGLEVACVVSDDVAELYRLAIRPEFAEARFADGGAGSRSSFRAVGAPGA